MKDLTWAQACIRMMENPPDKYCTGCAFASMTRVDRIVHSQPFWCELVGGFVYRKSCKETLFLEKALEHI